MKTRMLLSLVLFAGALVLASPGYPGAMVTQPGGPSLSGEGNPEDWGAPSLAPSGKPDDWGAPGFTPSGKPTDWDSPASSFSSTLGKPEDWEGPVRRLLHAITAFFYFR